MFGQSKMTLGQASALNRKARRRIGKLNGIKIVGTTKPFVSKK